MKKLKLVFFEGCPNAAKLKAILESLEISFELIDQELLREDDPLKRLTSPSIVIEDKLIFGSKLGSSADGGCSLEELNKSALRDLIHNYFTADRGHALETTEENPVTKIAVELKRLILNNGWNEHVRIHLDKTELWVRTLKPGCSYLSPDIIAHITDEDILSGNPEELVSKTKRKIQKYIKEHKTRY